MQTFVRFSLPAWFFDGQYQYSLKDINGFGLSSGTAFGCGVYCSFEKRILLLKSFQSSEGSFPGPFAVIVTESGRALVWTELKPPRLQWHQQWNRNAVFLRKRRVKIFRSRLVMPRRPRQKFTHTYFVCTSSVSMEIRSNRMNQLTSSPPPNPAWGRTFVHKRLGPTLFHRDTSVDSTNQQLTAKVVHPIYPTLVFRQTRAFDSTKHDHHGILYERRYSQCNRRRFRIVRKQSWVCRGRLSEILFPIGKPMNSILWLA